MSAGAAQTQQKPTFVDIALRGLALVVCVATLLGARALFGEGAGLAADGSVRGPWSPMAALALLVVGGLFFADIAQRIGAPRLVGYLAVGAFLGPGAFGIVHLEDVSVLSLVNELALSLIALSAGAELTPAMLGRVWKSAMASTVGQLLVVPLVCGVAFVIVAGMFPAASQLATGELWAVAAVFAALAISRSPTATMALLTELRAKGPLTEHALAVVIVLDVVVLVLFAAATSVAAGSLYQEPLSLETFTHLGQELFASVAAGTSLGLVIMAYLRLTTRGRVLFLVAVAYGVTAFCRFFGYDTLFVFVVAGFVVTNLSKHGPTLLHEVERLGEVVMVVFFATAGASLDRSALLQLGPPALILVAVRIAATWVGCRVGHRIADDPPDIRRYAHLAFVSQAGVTIGLAAIVADRLGAVGRELQALALASVAINTVLGPIALKFGLQRMGEIGAKDREPPPA